VVIVDHDGIVDIPFLRGLADIVEIVLEGEFGGVDADHHQSLVLIFFSPGPDIGKGAEPIDTGVGPKVDEHDFSGE